MPPLSPRGSRPLCAFSPSRRWIAPLRKETGPRACKGIIMQVLVDLANLV